MKQDLKTIDDESRLYEVLRRILESEQKRPVSFTEASDVGSNLLSFYETLAEEAPAFVLDRL